SPEPHPSGREVAARPAPPASFPPGFTGRSMQEHPLSGSALWQPDRGELILRGAGEGFFWEADSGYFMSQPVTGDADLTAELLAQPAEAEGYPGWGKAGLMIRDALAPGGRSAFLTFRPTHRLTAQWRAAPDTDMVTRELLVD